MKKYEQIYFTVEGPNDKALGWKTVLSLAFSLVAAVLIVIVALYADLIDRVMTFFVVKFPLVSVFFLFGFVLYFIIKRVRK